MTRTPTEALEAGERVIDGTRLLYVPRAVPDGDGAWLRRLAAELPWERHVVRLFGREHPAPRLSAYHGDADAAYRYSGQVYQPAAWTPALTELRELVTTVAGARFNAVLANRYADGAGGMGWHSDDEVELGHEPTIASLSFGAPRRFVLRHRRDRERARLELTLGNGDLLVMAGRCQADWHHSVPKTAKPVGERINLTFRLVTESPHQATG